MYRNAQTNWGRLGRFKRYNRKRRNLTGIGNVTFHPMKSFLRGPSLRSLEVDSVNARILRIPVVAAPLPRAAALATISSFNGIIPAGVDAFTGAIEVVDAAGATALMDDGWYVPARRLL